MPYVTSIERLARQEEAANLTVRQARKRFPAFGAADEAMIRRLSLAELEVLSEALLDFSTVEDLRRWLGGVLTKAP